MALLALTLIGTALAGAIVSDQVEVRGSTTCPRAAAVSEALAGLVPASERLTTPDVAELREEAGSIVIALRSPSGELIAEKRLSSTLSCAARATTSAVTIAAWEGRLLRDEEQPLALPELPVATQPPKGDTPVASVAPLGISRPPAPPSPTRAIDIRPGAAALASLAGNDLAPAARAEVVVGRAGSPFAAGMGVLLVGTHARAVGPGFGTWRRVGIDLALHGRSSVGRAELDARAGVALTALAIEGRSFPTNSGDTVFDPGAVVGLRVGVARAWASPWIEAAETFWPREHGLSVVGAENSAAIPRFEGLLSLGLSFGRGP